MSGIKVEEQTISDADYLRHERWAARDLRRWALERALQLQPNANAGVVMSIAECFFKFANAKDA